MPYKDLDKRKATRREYYLNHLADEQKRNIKRRDQRRVARAQARLERTDVRRPKGDEHYSWDVLVTWVYAHYPENDVGNNRAFPGVTPRYGGGGPETPMPGIGMPEFLGRNHNWCYRAQKRGWIDQWEADEVAIYLGVMPYVIWPEWLKEPDACDPEDSNLDSQLVQPES